jgi:serine protease Do
VSIVIKKDLPVFRNNPFGFFRDRVWSVETEIGWGTWFFVDTEWTIISNKHVVSDTNAKYSVVLNDWQSFDAEVLWLDPINDLAVLKINYESIPMKLRTKEEDIEIWQFVIAVWNALSEFQNSVSFWVVSGKNRVIQAGGSNLSSLIQTDTAINPGNSWWPLIDTQWKVIGINTAIAWSGQWIGFAIELSSEKIAYMLNSILEYWEIKKPFIGIYYIPINDSIASELWTPNSHWVYIPNEQGSIIRWSAADIAWLKQWDIILSIDGQKITEEYTLDILMQNKFPWEELELEVLSDWFEKITSLTLGDS